MENPLGLLVAEAADHENRIIAAASTVKAGIAGFGNFAHGPFAIRAPHRMRDFLLPRLISGKLSVEELDIAFPPGMAEV